MKLKVILIKDVKNLGTKDSVIDVPSGLAYNKLIPANEAILATPSNLKKVKSKARIVQAKNTQQKEEALKLKKLIEEMEFNFELEVHQNKAVGTITSTNLIDQINKRCNTNIDKRKVKLEHISNIGNYLATIHLFKGIDANARVVIKEKKIAYN